MIKIYPSEMKFLHRYALFLRQIVNNEFDAITLFEKTCNIFQAKIQRKAASVPNNEQTMFGENTASAIIIISATSQKIGTVVHANEELYHMFGFMPKDLVGKSVNLLMPR